MSSIKLSPNASGTGEFTIAAPNSNSNYTLTLPDQTGTVLTNAGPFTANASASNGAVTIDASNNVGIGTSSPSTKLHVQGNARSANAGNTVYTELQNDGVYATGTDLYLLAPASKFLAMYAGNAERTRITSVGTWCVNGTAPQIGCKQYLRFSGSAEQGILIQNLDNNSGGAAIRFVDYLGNYSGGGIYYTSSNSISYNTSSDYRLKENAQPMTGALAKVAALKPCTFTWKTDGRSGQGFIAHELQEVVPDAVTGVKDAVDAEGNPQYQGVDTSYLVATLTAAIQELNAKVQALEARLASDGPSNGAQA